MASPLLVEADVWHPCPHIEALEKVEGTAVFAHVPAREPGTIAHLVDIRGANPKAYLHELARQSTAVQARLLYRGEDGALAYCAQPADSLFVGVAARYGAVVADNPVTQDGKDHVLLLFPDGRALARLHRELREHFDIRIARKVPLPSKNSLGLNAFHRQGLLTLKTISELLTPRQREAFQLACAEGYYGLPQETTLAELARELGLHANTFSDHLRKAEAKLLPVLGKILSVL